MRTKICGILLLCVAVLLGAVACSGGGVAPNGMTAAEILAMSQNASMNTAQFTAVTNMDMMGETMEMYMVGAFDEANREMYMTMTASEVYDEAMQMYVVDDWVYITDEYGDWMKTALTDDIWEEQSPTTQQMGLMEGFIEAKYVAIENIGGASCYKIDIDPNWDAIFNATDLSGTEGISNEELIDMIKETSCSMWIAENTYFSMQIFFDMTMEMEVLGETYSVDMDMTMTFSNVNQPVTITLPLAANEAVEISYEDFIAEGY